MDVWDWLRGFFLLSAVGWYDGEAVSQVYVALTTCPIFRLCVLYSALFVHGACFTIGSYASSHLDSSVITLFAATQPPITAC